MFNAKYYEQKYDDLVVRRNKLMRAGKFAQLPKIDADIERVRQMIDDAKPRPVTEILPHDKIEASGLVPAVLETHFAADYLAACCYAVEDIVKKLGCNPITVVPELKEIIRRSNEFCQFMYSKDQRLRDMIIDDDTLMEALHKKTLSYITQRLKKADGKKKDKDVR